MNGIGTLPPHPGPLPWGEGETFSRFQKTLTTIGSIQREEFVK